MANTIVISVDDLTYWAGPQTLYSDQVRAPNIQRLTDMGVSFTNAYTSEAICNPARTSFFSGLTPNITGVHVNNQAWYEHVSPADTLTAHFLRAGYDVAGFGKLLHTQDLPEDIHRQMYSHFAPVSGFQNGASGFVQPLPGDVSEESMADHVSIDRAIAFLEGQDADTPFMLNVGLVKPHLNWVVPQEYFDLYPLDTIVVPGLVGDDMSNVPAFIRDQLEDSRGHPTPDNVLQAKKFMQGYLASLSYADAQIGRLLAALDAAGSFDDTTIMLWSDHGYHLGDRDNLWGKFTLWEEATKVPFVIKLPGNAQAGAVVDDVVNLVDAMPTLLDLAGLDIPDGLSGDSLVPLLYGIGPANGDGMSLTWMFGSVMLRTATHVFIRYEDGSEEMYDMIADPDQIHNLMGRPGQAVQAAALRTALIDKADIVLLTDGQAQGTAAGEMFHLMAAGEHAAGGGGDDRYYVNHSSAVVTEGAGGGRDIIFTSVDVALPDHVEDLVVSLYTGTAVSHLEGNALANTIIGSTGSERIGGGGGNDTLRGGGGGDTILGEQGNDGIVGSTGADLLDGGDGNDTLRGNGGRDTLFGGAGIDVLETRTGDVWLYGGEGADILVSAGGTALLEGGAGADEFRAAAEAQNTVSYLSSGTGVVASLRDATLNTGDAKGDRYQSIGNLAGSAFADWLEGNTATNHLSGDAGQDTLSGGAGEDVLNGGEGADRLDGGDGRDIAAYAVSAAGLRADLLLPGTNIGAAAGDIYSSIEGLRGGAGADLLLGDTQANLVEGGAGHDVIYGRAGNDTLRGGAGDDRFFGGLGADGFEGGTGFDTVQYAGTAGLRVDLLLTSTNTGEAVGDTYSGIEALRGGNGQDTLLGLTTGDLIDGDEGHDVIYGRAGNDTLRGGAGDDTLHGGTGADAFIFTAGRDRIVDLSLTEDDRLLIDLALLGGQALDGAQIVSTYAHVEDNSVVLDFGGGTRLLLEGQTDLAALGDHVFGL